MQPRKFFVVTRNPRSNALVPLQDGYELDTWESEEAARDCVKQLPTVVAWGAYIFEYAGVDAPKEV